MGVEALSNLLGGMAYYYGSIKVKENENSKWVYDEPRELFTATPSRSNY